MRCVAHESGLSDVQDGMESSLAISACDGDGGGRDGGGGGGTSGDSTGTGGGRDGDDGGDGDGGGGGGGCGDGGGGDRASRASVTHERWFWQSWLPMPISHTSSYAVSIASTAVRIDVYESTSPSYVVRRGTDVEDAST